MFELNDNYYRMAILTSNWQTFRKNRKNASTLEIRVNELAISSLLYNFFLLKS